MKLDYEKLSQYPDILNKEQFRELCHISKRTALYYLQKRLIPSWNNGKKTHCWQIQKKDIIQFAMDYEKNPFRYRAPDNWYVYEESNSNEGIDLRSIPTGEEYQISAKDYYYKIIEKESDILVISDITRITGYGRSTIYRWIHKGELRIHYAYQNKFFIPKIFLYYFLIGSFYDGIKQKSCSHLQAIHEIYNAVFYGKVMPNDLFPAKQNISLFKYNDTNKNLLSEK